MRGGAPGKCLLLRQYRSSRPGGRDQSNERRPLSSEASPARGAGGASVIVNSVPSRYLPIFREGLKDIPVVAILPECRALSGVTVGDPVAARAADPREVPRAELGEHGDSPLPPAGSVFYFNVVSRPQRTHRRPSTLVGPLPQPPLQDPPPHLRERRRPAWLSSMNPHQV